MAIITSRRLDSYHKQAVKPIYDAFPHEVEMINLATGEISFILTNDDGTILTDDDGTELSVSKYISMQ